jgi:hypothetical protein
MYDYISKWSVLLAHNAVVRVAYVKKVAVQKSIVTTVAQKMAAFVNRNRFERLFAHRTLTRVIHEQQWLAVGADWVLT